MANEGGKENLKNAKFLVVTLKLFQISRKSIVSRVIRVTKKRI
jgi:hypothetical protein